MSTRKTCGCKGIRTCLHCEESSPIGIKSHYREKDWKTYIYCDDCKKAWSAEGGRTDHQTHVGTDVDSFDFPGLTILKDFLNPKEEDLLCAEIDKTQWSESQSGRRKQDYGPKVNFKKRKLKTSVFTGLPHFSKTLVDRMQQSAVLNDFYPIELCNLEYVPERGSAIEPHFDDFWIWGERLVTLNLLAETRHRMTIDSQPDVEVFIPLPRRSLAVMQGPARHEWKHGIIRKDITTRRIGVTFRELTPEFMAGGSSEAIGQELLDIASTYEGVAVGSQQGMAASDARQL